MHECSCVLPGVNLGIDYLLRMKSHLNYYSPFRLQLAISSKQRSHSFIKIIRMASTIQTPRDPNTLSNYNHFLTTHTTANFAIDFEQKSLRGNVILNLKSITNTETAEILLDTSYLEIHDVKIDGQAPKWNLLPRFEPYGSALKIELENRVQNAASVEVDVGSNITLWLLSWRP